MIMVITLIILILLSGCIYKLRKEIKYLKKLMSDYQDMLKKYSEKVEIYKKEVYGFNNSCSCRHKELLDKFSAFQKEIKKEV